MYVLTVHTDPECQSIISFLDAYWRHENENITTRSDTLGSKIPQDSAWLKMVHAETFKTWN